MRGGDFAVRGGGGEAGVHEEGGVEIDHVDCGEGEEGVDEGAVVPVDGGHLGAEGHVRCRGGLWGGWRPSKVVMGIEVQLKVFRVDELT